MQVYFIDNDDYFKRKQTYADEKGVFFADNAERAVFFARGVLETAKKLRWTPDIIHCQGWISHILPLYLKKVYREDPIFANTKVVLSLYDDTPKDMFSSDFASLIKFSQVSDQDVAILSEPTGTNLAKLAAQYSDGIILGSENVDEEVVKYCKELGLPILPYNGKSYEDGSYIDEYNGFYEQLQ